MISRWSAKTLKSTQMYRTVMESFRNSSKARFFQPGFSSCIMVTVLVGEEELLAAKSQARPSALPGASPLRPWPCLSSRLPENGSSNDPPKTNAKVPALITVEFIFGEHLCSSRDHRELS